MKVEYSAVCEHEDAQYSLSLSLSLSLVTERKPSSPLPPDSGDMQPAASSPQHNYYLR